MIRVLHVLRFLNNGGASRSTCAMARPLDRSGEFENRIVSLLPATAIGLELARRAGIPVLDAPGWEAVRAEMAAADVVQVHWWNAPQIDELLRAGLPPLRLLVFLHVAGDVPPNIVTRELVDFADVCVAGCGYAHRCAAIAGLPPEERARKTAVVTATTDFDRLGDLAPRPHEGFNVGYVGTVEFKKMHPDFVAMSARVRVPGVRFIVCGKGHLDVLARQIAALGAGDRFELRGYVEDVGPVLASLDVFGYPLCANPGAELAVQEAMLAGVPPVVFGLGGLQDAVSHGMTGLVVNDAEEYTAAIEYLYRHPEERRRLGENARAFAQREFGGENSGRKMARIYERMMALPKRTRSWPGEAGSGAALFAASMAEAGAPFRTSLAATAATATVGDELLAAEAAIAASSQVVLWGLEQYRNHYPQDPHLRLWTGLVLAAAGEHAAARAQLASAAELGLPPERVARYLEREPE